ncbi:MAG: RNA-binding cell elongation regulator Jag/EloR [Chloroflexota bacterium]
MESVEVSARSVEEAIAEALRRLGIAREQVEVAVISEGSRGILGLGAEEARVRVWAREPVRHIPEEGPLGSQGEVLAAGPVGEGQVEAEPPWEAGAIARQVVEELLRSLEVMASAAIRQPEAQEAQLKPGEQPVVIDVSGEDLGVLIGRRGETLDALQYITNLIVNRRTRRRVKVIVDVESYRRRREASLRGLAARMADRVRASRQAVTLEAMPAHERRLVHLSLQDDPDVYTQSVGEGEGRKVVISPRPEGMSRR